MKKALIAFAAVATIAVGTFAAPDAANARCRGCVVGGAILAAATPRDPRRGAQAELTTVLPRGCDNGTRSG